MVIHIEQAIDRECYSCSGGSTQNICKHDERPVIRRFSNAKDKSAPAVKSKERIQAVQFTLMIAAVAITWRKLIAICTEQSQEVVM